MLNERCVKSNVAFQSECGKIILIVTTSEFWNRKLLKGANDGNSKFRVLILVIV